MRRFGSTTWNGSLREGQGAVSTESLALENSPYSFFTRYGEKSGTNPEELFGAAHAACFTMSFVGRSKETRLALLKDIHTRVAAAAGISPDDLMITVYEVPGENISFGQGEAQRANAVAPA
jgi:organic hydroperoxide reductase OsmC/OhrA